MSFISPANHTKLRRVLEDSISAIESNDSGCKTSAANVTDLKNDLDFLNNLFLEYNNKLHEINRIINSYNNVEKRARGLLRQYRRKLEKLKSVS